MKNAVSQLAQAILPTRFGAYQIAVFAVDGGAAEVVALLHGALDGATPPLVRLHSECLTGEALGSLRCDCGGQLDTALERIGESGAGILLYLRQEGRGIGLANKVRAYALQDGGLDTVDANVALGLPVDGREYASAAAVLRFLGVEQVRLLTNNPAKQQALEDHRVRVVERVPLEIAANAVNLSYLLTKADRMGHLFNHQRPLGQASLPPPALVARQNPASLLGADGEPVAAPSSNGHRPRRKPRLLDDAG